jgi:hypothetical protein
MRKYQCCDIVVQHVHAIHDPGSVVAHTVHGDGGRGGRTVNLLGIPRAPRHVVTTRGPIPFDRLVYSTCTKQRFKLGPKVDLRR